MDCPQTEKLTIRDLSVDFRTSHGMVHAVRNVSLEVKKGRITALVGESGSGKSVTSLAVMGLLARNGRLTGGSIVCEGKELTVLKKKDRQKLNGKLFGMIFQDPSASLDPLFTVEDQMVEGIVQHQRIPKKDACGIALRYLQAVNLKDPESIMKKRPFELSGGMCQRVMIALTMALQPDFLIADEPTTALDVTVQKQILSQVYHLSRDQNMGILFITHDLGVVAEIADDVAIMQNGEIVEQGDVMEIFDHAKHPYTQKLLSSIL